MVLKTGDCILAPCLQWQQRVDIVAPSEFCCSVTHSCMLSTVPCRHAPACKPSCTVMNRRCRLTSTADSPVNMSTYKQAIGRYSAEMQRSNPDRACCVDVPTACIWSHVAYSCAINAQLAMPPSNKRQGRACLPDAIAAGTWLRLQRCLCALRQWVPFACKQTPSPAQTIKCPAPGCRNNTQPGADQHTLHSQSLCIRRA